MGEMADAAHEDGAIEWLQHLQGECADPCPYCDAEDEAAAEEEEPS